MNPSDLTTWCDRLEQALADGLPGKAAQGLMAPVPRRSELLPGQEARQRGSVLLLLYGRADGLCLPVTRRSEQVAYHKGQISLPGGAWEPMDSSLAATALREAWEELGVEPEQVRLLGKLTPLYVVASGYCVHPYVACCPAVPVFSPSPVEVAEVIELPVRLLFDPAARAEEYRQLHGEQVLVPFYQVGEHKIWGATAMILSEFAALLAGLPHR